MIRVDPLSGLKTLVADAAPLLHADARAPGRDAEPDLFATQPATGVHERLTLPVPLGALDPAQVAAALESWRERLRAHAGAACLHLAAEGDAADLLALDFVPALIARERERFGAHAVRTMGSNLLGDLVQEEVRRRERLVAVDDEAVLISAFAPRGSYHLLLAPRRPRARFEDDGPLGAALLHDALRRLRAELGDVPVALWLRTAPRGADHFCWRIELLPRLALAGALELGAALPVCTVGPEDAAAALRAR